MKSKGISTHRIDGKESKNDCHVRDPEFELMDEITKGYSKIMQKNNRHTNITVGLSIAFRNLRKALERG